MLNNLSSFLTIEKPWGSEVILEANDKYALKILNVASGKRLSLQYHQVKDETIVVLEGHLELHIGHSLDNIEIKHLLPGEKIRIIPGVIHRFCANDIPVKLLEVSSPELTDVVRLSDDFNRI